MSTSLRRETDTQGATVLVKTADESVTSSTTLQDDDTLQFAVTAGLYRFFGKLAIDSADNVGYKMSFAGPASIAGHYFGYWTAYGSLAPAGQLAYTIGDLQDFTDPPLSTWSDFEFHFKGAFYVPGSGTFKLTWCQSASSATAAKVLAGSYLAYQVQA